MPPNPRRVALLAILLSLLALVLWLGRSGPGSRMASPDARPNPGSATDQGHPVARDPAKAESPSPSSAKPEPTPAVLASRLAAAPILPRPATPKKPGPAFRTQPLEIDRGRVVERRDSPPDGAGRFRRATVYQTEFKYPFLRVEQQVMRDHRGAEVVTAQLVMVADHLLVKIQPGADPAMLQSHLAAVGARVLRHLPNSPFYTVVLRGHSVAEFDRALSSLEAAPGPLAYAEPDFISLGGGTPVIPNDPSFPLQWDLHNTGQNGGTAGADIRAPEAWSVTTGSSGIIVAVIDSGIDLNHPDLAANLWTNPGESGGGRESDTLDNDGNGYADDVHGWNFVSGNATPMDDHGHGSHTSGTVGAVGGNGTGISGVAPIVRLMPLKFLNANGSGTDSDAIEAINYATTNHALLSSNSWGGAGFSQAMFDVIADAHAAGVGFVAAAGNSGISNDKYASYPANFEVPNVISVAATDNTDTLAWFSNFGAGTVHLAAPGVETYSTFKNGGYTTMSGTSMAAPHVSGAAALLKAANPALTFAQIKAMLVSQCDPQPSLAGKTASGGRLNVAKALVPATGPLLTADTLVVDDDPANGATGNADHIASPGETIRVTIPVRNAGAFLSPDVQGTLSLKSNGIGLTLANPTAAYATIAGGATSPNAAPFEIAIAANKAPADVVLTLSLNDSQGNNWSVDLTLRVRTVAALAGTVTKVTGNGVFAGATVTITGPENHTLTTGADGTYAITLPNGTYAVQARAAGYIPSPPRTITLPPSNTAVDFALGYSAGIVAPLTMSSTQNEGDQQFQTLTLTNNGDQDLTYKILEIPPAPAGNPGALTLLPPPSSPRPNPATDTAPRHTVSLTRLLDASDNAMSPLPFRDGFEDGMWGRWFPSQNDTRTREVVADTAGTGSKSFHLHNNGADGHLTGIEQVYEWGSQPGYVNFWVRPGPEDLATAYTVLGDVILVFDGFGFHYELADFIWFFANANGRFYLNDDVGGNQSVLYTAGQWYHVEFRNINWTAKNFDYWVDGQLVQAGVPFRNPLYAGEMILSFHYNYSGGDTDAWWDDFQFYDSELPWLRLSSRQGTVPPGQSVNVTAIFDASHQLAGSYHGSLLVQTNDPANPATTVPVSLTVNAVPNQPPVAVPQSLTLGLNATQAITLGGSDADNDPLTCRIVALPARGALYQTSDGVNPGTRITNTPTVVSHPQRKVIFQPAAGDSGTPYASFRFILSDPKIDSAPATIGIDVTSWPSLTVSPPGADSFDPVTVTFSVSDPLAVIRLTTDGTPPTASSLTLANGATFRVDHPLTLTASAALGNNASPAQAFVFTITDANHNGLPDWWELQHPGIGIAGLIDPAADSDGDGLSNLKEFILGTDPASNTPYVPAMQNPQQPLLTWPSITGRLYGVEASGDLVTWQEVAAPRPGTGDTMSWQESQPPAGPRFYRVRVILP